MGGGEDVERRYGILIGEGERGREGGLVSRGRGIPALVAMQRAGSQV